MIERLDREIMEKIKCVNIIAEGRTHTLKKKANGKGKASTKIFYLKVWSLYAEYGGRG